MTRLVKTSCLLGDQWTVITREQATYEAAAAIRDKYKDEFNNVVLLLGLHLAHKYVKVICEITKDSGLCQEGTAMMFRGKLTTIR